MKSISSSIFIFSSCAVFMTASCVLHSDTELFVNQLAWVVGVIGLTGWFRAGEERVLRERLLR